MCMCGFAGERNCMCQRVFACTEVFGFLGMFVHGCASALWAYGIRVSECVCLRVQVYTGGRLLDSLVRTRASFFLCTSE